MPAPPPRITAATLLALTFSPWATEQQTVSARAAAARRARAATGWLAHGAWRTGTQVASGAAEAACAVVARPATRQVLSAPRRPLLVRRARVSARRRHEFFLSLKDPGWVRRAGAPAGGRRRGIAPRQPQGRAACRRSRAAHAPSGPPWCQRARTESRAALRQGQWRKTRPRGAGERSAPTPRPRAWRRATHRRRCDAERRVSGRKHTAAAQNSRRRHDKRTRSALPPVALA